MPVFSALCRRVGVVLAAVSLAAISIPTAAEAGPRRHRDLPNLVVLGDSFAAGTGNTPYLTGSLDAECSRSDKAYGPLLAETKHVRLRAFVACGGATTLDVSGIGPQANPAQIDSITADTDVITVQALGNDFAFGDLVELCLGGDCSPDKPFKGGTVKSFIDEIPDGSRVLLGDMNSAIQRKIKQVGSSARVIVVGYADPYPGPNTPHAASCPPQPEMTEAELGVARDYTLALNEALTQGAQRYRFGYVDPSAAFAGSDLCGPNPAFFGPFVSDGALHPNAVGQGLYADVVARRLCFPRS